MSRKTHSSPVGLPLRIPISQSQAQAGGKGEAGGEGAPPLSQSSVKLRLRQEGKEKGRRGRRGRRERRARRRA